MIGLAIALWALMLLAGIPLSRRFAHPESKKFAAYLLFVMIFSAVSAFLFYALFWVLETVGRTDVLANPLVAAAAMVAVFAPALLAAIWQVRKPPRRVRPPR